MWDDSELETLERNIKCIMNYGLYCGNHMSVGAPVIQLKPEDICNHRPDPRSEIFGKAKCTWIHLHPEMDDFSIKSKIVYNRSQALSYRWIVFITVNLTGVGSFKKLAVINCHTCWVLVERTRIYKYRIIFYCIHYE